MALLSYVEAQVVCLSPGLVQVFNLTDVLRYNISRRALASKTTFRITRANLHNSHTHVSMVIGPGFQGKFTIAPLQVSPTLHGAAPRRWAGAVLLGPQTIG